MASKPIGPIETMLLIGFIICFIPFVMLYNFVCNPVRFIGNLRKGIWIEQM